MGCAYATPVATTSEVGTEFEVTVRQGDRCDGIVSEENFVLHQQIPNYTVVVDEDKVVAYGSAIGMKQMILRDA